MASVMYLSWFQSGSCSAAQWQITRLPIVFVLCVTTYFSHSRAHSISLHPSLFYFPLPGLAVRIAASISSCIFVVWVMSSGKTPLYNWDSRGAAATNTVSIYQTASLPSSPADSSTGWVTLVWQGGILMKYPDYALVVYCNCVYML